MSISIMSWVWQTSPSRGRELLVELALADFADDSGRCYPAISTIAAKARCTIRHVQATIRRLEAQNRLRVEVNAGPHGVNVYRLLPLQPLQGEMASPLQTLTAGGEISDIRGEISDRGGEVGDRGGEVLVSVISPDPSDPSLDPSEEPSTDPPASTARAGAQEREPICVLYEQRLGQMVTPLLAEELRTIEGEYPADWIEAAFEEVTSSRERIRAPLKFIRAVLNTWARDGRPHGAEGGNTAREQLLSRYRAMGRRQA